VWTLSKTEVEKDICAPTFCMHGEHDWCTGRMGNSLGAWDVFSCPSRIWNALGAFCLPSGPNLQFYVIFRSLSSNNLSWYFGNKIPLICNLLRPLESSFLFLESSQFFNCSWFAHLHDFFVNYFKNPLKLLCFGKTRITELNIKNITKVSKS